MKQARFRINLYQDQAPKRSLRQTLVVALLAGVVLAMAGEAAFGADVMRKSSLEAQSKSGVSSASTLAKGQFASGLVVENHNDPLPIEIVEDENSAEEKNNLAKSIQSMSVFFGVGLSSFADISVGVHGTRDELSEERREELFPVESEDERKDKPVDTAFAGATLMSKFRVLDLDAIEIAAAPFVQSGAGEQAEDSVSRSERVRGGWMLLASYKAPQVVQVDTNFGYRYRNSERVGRYRLRNEMFYRAAVEAFFSKNASIFLAGTGRQISAAREDREEGEKREYRDWNSADLTAGLGGRFSSFELRAYGGQRLMKKSLGAGRQIFGAQMSYVFGSKRSAKSFKTRIAASDSDTPSKTDSSEEDLDKWEPSADKSAAKNPDRVLLPEEKNPAIITDADKDLGPSEDFDSVKQRVKDSEKLNEGTSPSLQFEEEYRQLKEAEEKSQAEEARKQAIEERRVKKERLKKLDEEQDSLRKARKKIRNDESFPEEPKNIHKWDGLE